MMLWLQHLFAICVLAHMLWAAILLQREWQRVRRHDGPGYTQRREGLADALASAEVTHAGTR